MLLTHHIHERLIDHEDSARGPQRGRIVQHPRGIGGIAQDGHVTRRQRSKGIKWWAKHMMDGLRTENRIGLRETRVHDAWLGGPKIVQQRKRLRSPRSQHDPFSRHPVVRSNLRLHLSYLLGVGIVPQPPHRIDNRLLQPLRGLTGDINGKIEARAFGVQVTVNSRIKHWAECSCP